MTVNFYLDKNNNTSKQERAIFVYIRFGKKTITVHSGEKIDPRHWDVKKQAVKKSYVGSPELNSFLNYIKEEIKKLHRQSLVDDIKLSQEEFKERIKQIIGKTQPENTNQIFFNAFERFRESKKISRSIRTLQKYDTLQDHLKSFQTAKKYTLTFEKINYDFFERFTDYMFADLKLTNNTVGKYISTLKTFLIWANEMEIAQNTAYRRFKVFEEKADIIYLTQEELDSIQGLDLEKDHLVHVRDVFCFACYTGQRFSDISRLSSEDIKDGYWHLRSYKTKDIIKIPLLDKAKQILEKYKEWEKPLPIISHQKTNDYIKEVCKLAEIKEQVTLTKYRAAEKIETTKPKYELVTTHTARRTFVTLSLEKGLRPEMVMEITGHKEYKTMKKYMKITDKRKEIEMKQAWEKEKLIKIAV